MARRTPPATVLFAGWLAAATIVAYPVWIGWDRHHARGYGTVSGPYAAWQITGLVVTLAVLAGLAGWSHRSVSAILVMPVALAVCFAINDQSTDTGDSGNLWMIGDAVIFAASVAGVALVTAGSHAGGGPGAQTSRHRRIKPSLTDCPL
jgi:hypothetical protein